MVLWLALRDSVGWVCLQKVHLVREFSDCTTSKMEICVLTLSRVHEVMTAQVPKILIQHDLISSTSQDGS